MASTVASPKITLYTNYGCPFAHRAHITLKELDLPHEEVQIDITKPREPWYLEVNPRGLVPAIRYTDDVYTDEIITESAILTHFLADTKPSTLLPRLDRTSEPRAALMRARIAYFTDTWDGKGSKSMTQILTAKSDEERAASCAAWVEAIGKDLEPLLKDASPFFGGSKNLTMAEVHVAPWIVRTYALTRAGEMPANVVEGFDKLPNFSRWAKAVREHPSVRDSWDEQRVVSFMKERLSQMRQAANK